MSVRTHCLAAAFGIAVVLGAPSAAHAAGWVAPVSGGVLTGYGVSCASGTHRGVDLGCDAGEVVRAPSGGTVVFAGQVPADGGGTCGAVTIELADGLRLSLLPLESVSVAEGDAIDASTAIGTVAGTGDDSSTAVHVHLSVRRGDAYLDPTALLPASPQAITPVPVVPDAGAAGPETPFTGGTAAGAAAGTSGAGSYASSGVSAAVAVTPGVQAPTALAPVSHAAGDSAVGAGRGLLADAGVPVPSQLVPNLTYVRGGLHALVTARPLGSAVAVASLLGMIAVGALLVREHRSAVVVRARS